METLIPALLKIDWLGALGADTALLGTIADVAAFALSTGKAIAYTRGN